MIKSNIYFSRITNFSNVGKFIAIAVLCGGASSFARFFISDIVQKKVRWEDPIHMSWLPSTCLGIAAFLAGVLLTFVLVKVIIGEGYLDRNIFIWIFIGILYGIFIPFVTGLLLPMGMFVMNVSIGVIELNKAFYFFLDAIVLAPTNAFTHGIFGVISGLVCGMCLPITLWLMDIIQRFGPRWQFGLGIAFSVFMIGFSKFAPPPFLANFG